MDDHARWLRRHVWSVVLHRALRLGAFTGLLVAGLTFAATRSPWLAVPWGGLFAQLVPVAVAWRTWRRPPMAGPDIAEFSDRRLVFRPAPLEPLGDLGQLLVRRDLVPVSLLGARDTDAPDDLGHPRFEVYQSANHTVTVLRVRSSSPRWPYPTGATDPVLFLTLLGDDRILVTSDLVQLPRRALFLNPRPGRTPTQLLDDHRQAVAALAKKGLPPRTAGVELAVDYIHQQQRALRDLGPAAGFVGRYGPDPNKGPRWRFRVDIPGRELRRLALTTTLDERMADARAA